MQVRPASASDAESDAFDVEPDCWREGGNRRSFVAVDEDGVLLGHCRGIDNVFHPDSRVLVLETAPEVGDDVAGELLDAQLAVSTLPLRCKPTRQDTTLLALAERRSGRVVQLMPPWRHPLSPAMRRWAAAHRDVSTGRIVPIDDVDPDAVAALFVQHYVEQHATWSPAAHPDVLREAFADFLAPDGTGARDPRRSVALVRDGVLVAQSLVDAPSPDGSEVVLQTLPRSGEAARADLAACLAATIDRADDGDLLLIDAHLTESTEMALMRDVPSPDATEAGEWTAIVTIPLPGSAAPRCLAAADVPDAAAWVRTLAP